MKIAQLVPENYVVMETEYDWTEKEWKRAVHQIYQSALSDPDTGCINVWSNPDGAEPFLVQLGKKQKFNVGAIMFYDYYGVWAAPCLRHLCNNSRCINLYHLWIGDTIDLTLDAAWRRVHGSYFVVPKNYFTCPDLDFRRAWPSPAHFLEQKVLGQLNIAIGQFTVPLS